MFEQPGWVALFPDDVALYMQGAGANGSSYSHWMKWNLPSLVDGLSTPRNLPYRAYYRYVVADVKCDAFIALGSVLWTNSDVSWTSSTSLATLKTIRGDDGAYDLQRAIEAKKITSDGSYIDIAESGDMPTGGSTVHLFDITARVHQIYLANSLGACQMTTRHAVDFFYSGSDTSVAEQTIPGTHTSTWLQHVTKPSSTKLYQGWAYSWDKCDEGEHIGIALIWEGKPQTNAGVQLFGGFN
jgi:hypothetical protein